ncbi:MAG: peptidylprolyl isomerase [Lysobacteraceae bacterium]|nr:MAG: peptidylprolyl isomerase [Xanthomonadaceae bacterium]
MRTITVLLVMLLLAACQADRAVPDPGRAALAGAPDGPLIATVNGEAITEPVLAAYARGKGLDPAQPEQRQQALDALIEAVLLAQDALGGGLADGTAARAEAALVRMQFLANQALAAQRGAVSIGEAEVQALYERERQRAGDTEWRAQHLLFDDEESARKALERARAPGASFEALIAEYARGGARQARELPWSNATQLPEALVEALRQLEDGEVAPVVIHSPYGWHVLRRVEARPFSPPPLEKVRAGAMRQLMEEARRDYLAGLRAKADIRMAGEQAGTGRD